MIEIFVMVLIVYMVYYFVSVNRYDKSGNLKGNQNKKDKVTNYQGLPSEVKYFIKRYNIDLDKVNLRGVLKLTGLVLGIDIAILTLLVILIFKDKVVIELLVASLLIIPLYLVSLKFVGRYFEKKGLVKNDRNKKNRK